MGNAGQLMTLTRAEVMIKFILEKVHAIKRAREIYAGAAAASPFYSKSAAPREQIRPQYMLIVRCHSPALVNYIQIHACQHLSWILNHDFYTQIDILAHEQKFNTWYLFQKNLSLSPNPNIQHVCLQMFFFYSSKAAFLKIIF